MTSLIESESSRRSGERADVLWITGAAVALLAYWFWRVLPHARLPGGLGGGDLMFQFLPDHTYLAERLRAGELPLWNPYQGQPFLATLLPGTFYPARALLLVLDVPTAMHVSTLAHLLLGGGATYALCRALHASRVGALAGAVTFTGVHALPNVYSPAYLEGGAWLPVAGLALARLAATGAWRWALTLGTAVGLMVLAGSYQHTLYAVYGLGVLALALLADRDRRGRLATPGGIAKVLAAAVLALATAAPQLVPTLAWSAETVRGMHPLTDRQVDPFPFPMQTLRGMFLPPTAYTPIYVSIPVVMLALLGCAGARWFGAVLLAATVGTIALTLGRGTPAFALFLILPGFAEFRNPARLVFLVAFLVAIGAALGTSRIERSAWGGRPAAAAAVLVIAWMLFAPPRAALIFPWTAPPQELAGPPALMQAVVDHTPGGRVLLPGEAAGDGIAVKHGTMRHVLGLQDYNPLSSRRLAAYLNAMVGKPAPRSDDPNLFLGWVPMNQPIVRPELLDAMAVRTLVSRSFVRPPRRTPPLRPLLTGGRWTLYGNPHALPRAFTVTRARVVPDQGAALALLGQPGFDLRREAVLAGALDADAIEALSEGDPTPLRPAGIVHDAAEHVAVDVDLPRPAVLVLTDPLAPGWSATANGTPVPIFEANGLGRGVVVAAGRTRVEFVYEAPGLRLGGALAVVGWGLTLVGTLALWFVRRRHEAPPQLNRTSKRTR